MVDAVMRRIEEEEATAAQEARQRQQDAQQDIQRFLAQQQELKKRCLSAGGRPWGLQSFAEPAGLLGGHGEIDVPSKLCLVGLHRQPAHCS